MSMGECESPVDVIQPQQSPFHPYNYKNNELAEGLKENNFLHRSKFRVPTLVWWVNNKNRREAWPRTIKNNKGPWSGFAKNFTTRDALVIHNVQWISNTFSLPFIKFNFEGTRMREHIIICSHAGDDCVHWLQSDNTSVHGPT